MKVKYNNNDFIYGLLYDKKKFNWTNIEYIPTNLMISSLKKYDENIKFKNKISENIIININNKRDLVQLIKTDIIYSDEDSE